MKAEEVNRHLEYLGYEGYALGQPRRPCLLSTRSLPIVMAVVLCALILVGMAAYAARPLDSLPALAQVGQNTSEHLIVVPSPVDSGGFLETALANADPAATLYSGQHFSSECLGPWYPIVLGLLACHG